MWTQVAVTERQDDFFDDEVLAPRVRWYVMVVQKRDALFWQKKTQWATMNIMIEYI